MALRQYITIMAIATTLCWVSWFFVIVNIDPFQGSLIGFLFFYVTLFSALLGANSLLIFSVYWFFSGHLPLFRYVQKSFRESFFLSLFIVFMLFLQGMRWLNFWNVGLLLLLSALIISFLFSMHRRHRRLF